MPPHTFQSDWVKVARPLEVLAADALGAGATTPERKNVRGRVGHFVIAAKHAVESLHYLADLDDATFREDHPRGGHPSDATDEAHVRWASGSAITGVDLCAAALGRVHKLVDGSHELSMRDLTVHLGDPSKKKAAAYFAALGTDWKAWARAVYADPVYIRCLAARNPLTHADAPRAIYSGASGHANRYGYRFGGFDNPDALTISGRTVIEEARDMATRHVEAFFAIAAALPQPHPYPPP
jgi:hypothetical protein